MNRAIFFMLAAALSLAVLVLPACEMRSGDRDDGTPGESSTLEADLLTILDSMRDEASQYAGSPDRAGVRSGYHNRMDDGIIGMSDIWDQMRVQCQQYSADCPAGGGATGNEEGQCMWGGHMMDQDRMGRLQSFIDSCRTLLGNFWGACGESWGDGCPAMSDQHVQQMSALLDEMWADCNDWFDDGGTPGGEHGHWGSCGSDHHNGDMMDDDHMGGGMGNNY
jgi:hypothetical protein